MKVFAVGRTDVGMKRNHNEDNYLLVEDQCLYVVADGMGGHACGEVASQMAVENLAKFFKETSENDEVTWPFKEEKGLRYEENRLVTAIKLANLRIFESSTSDSRFRGMGTTVVGSLFTDGTVYIGHVGDSRAYRFRGGVLEQLTEDHSLLNDYIRANKLTPEEIEAFPHKNVIVRALGMKEGVQVDVSRLEPMANDVYVLCSDGLSGPVPDAEITEILGAHPDIVEAANALIARANENGGPDNITAVLVKVVES
ncbi:MAG: Stp1/IreP family PP2C-type Ser/Thr phosphatase [Deltaproteobacteria bacterium]|nr:Stp1/IreP family PP2C-type Ser/Thr phosphatase [Deltaproteobacteria bacterium]